ncbi:MAG: DUF1963 domain-containing protein [Actinocrinis sp.]
MQMSDSPPAQAGRDFFSAQDAQTWIGLLRPGFHLRALDRDAARDEPVVAYLGGRPMLPEQVEWPVWQDHGPLNFVAALDCSQVPVSELDIPLPASGQLLFFYFDGLGDSSIVSSDADSVVNGTRVIYVADDAEIAERSAPEDMTPYPRLLLTGELIATVPDNENPALAAAYGDPNDPVAYCDYPTVDPDGTGFWAALGKFRGDHWPHHQIGGYAQPVQGAVEPEGARALYQEADEPDDAAAPNPTDEAEQTHAPADVSGPDQSMEPDRAIDPDEPTQTGEADASDEAEKEPDDAAIRELASQLVLLAQFDSDSRSGMAWGDTGKLYWMIRREDLAAGRFDKSTFTWQSE